MHKCVTIRKFRSGNIARRTSTFDIRGQLTDTAHAMFRSQELTQRH
jgi:hypothetical protein